MIKFAFFWVCGECDEPTSTFEICTYLGYNPGVDGHLFKDEATAREAWDLFEKALRKENFFGDADADEMRKIYPDIEEHINHLRNNVSLFKVDIAIVE